MSVATRMHTRKVAELVRSDRVSLLWQEERKGSGKASAAWVAVMGSARVVEEKNEGLPPDSEQRRGKVLVTVERLELQDYDSAVMAGGWDNWRPAVLQREGGAWRKLQ